MPVNNATPVCWLGLDGSETTTSTLTVNSCPPRWIRSNKTGAYGGWRNWSAKTEQQCLDACVANSSCVAVDWVDRYGTWGDLCWMHNKHGRYYTNNAATHIEIIRRCNTKSSTWHRTIANLLTHNILKLIFFRLKLQLAKIHNFFLALLTYLLGTYASRNLGFIFDEHLTFSV